MGRKRIAVLVAAVAVVGGIATTMVVTWDDDGPGLPMTKDAGGHADRAHRTRLVLDCGTGTAPSGIMDDFTPKGYETPAAAVH